MAKSVTGCGTRLLACLSSRTRQARLHYLSQPRVQEIPGPVSQEVKRHHGKEDRHPREEGNLPRYGQVVLAVGYHRAPCRGRRRYSDAKIAEYGFRQDQPPNVQGRYHHHCVDDARQDVGGGLAEYGFRQDQPPNVQGRYHHHCVDDARQDVSEEYTKCRCARDLRKRDVVGRL